MASQPLSEEQLKAIAQALKSRREEKGENLAEVAFRIALSPSQLRAIESADRGPFYSPDYFLQAANRYADFLGITLEIPEREAAPEPESVAIATDAPLNMQDSAPGIEAPCAEPLAQPISGLAVAITPDTAETPAANVTRDAVATPMSPHSEDRKSIPWGWIALGASALIALGIVKIRLEKPNKAAESLVKAPATVLVENAAPVTPKDAASANPAASANAAAAPTATAVASTTSITSKSSPPTSTAAGTLGAASLGNSAPIPAPKSNTGPTPATPNDGQLESQVQTWVQIVKSNGEKINTRIEPGQKIGFVSASTAAIVFGQPDKAQLKIQGRSVNLAPFITPDTPPRALVILNQIKN